MGQPPPTLTWTYNNIELSISNKYSIFSDGSLVVLETVVGDSGQYVCSGVNSRGQSQAIVDLQVVEGED